MPRRFILIVVSVVAVVGMAVAGERYYRNINETGEFDDITVNRLYRDSTGYVWMATDRGVLKCDGIHTRLIRIGDEVQPLFITSFESLPGGGVAVGTRRGLVKIDSRGRVSRVDDGTPEITSLVRWSADTIVAGTAHGLVAYDNDGSVLQFNQLPVDNLYSPAAYVNALAFHPGGDLFIQTHKALYRMDRATGDVRLLTEWPVWADTSRDMVADGDRVWIAMMSSGLWRVDALSGEAVQVDVNCPVITGVSLSPEGLYVGTDGNGVYLLDRETAEVKSHITRRVNRVGSPNSSQVYCVMSDGMGVLWIGYYQHGADYTVSSSGLFEVFSDGKLFNSYGTSVRTITAGDRGLAIGTRDGLVLLRPGVRMEQIHRPQLNSDMVIAVKQYRGKIYIGTYGGGISVLDPETLQVVPFQPDVEVPFNRGHVFSLAVDANDMLWLGTSNGLYCYDGDRQVRHYTTADSELPTGNVYEVFFDSTGRGWICTENGVCLYDPVRGVLLRDSLPDYFPRDEKIRVVYEDSSHTLYFLPERGDILVASVDLSDVRPLKLSALAGSDAKSIIEDQNSYIWITSNRGVIRWDKRDEVIKFGQADGLPSAQFIQCTPVIDADGRLLLGNSNGMVSINTDLNLYKRVIDSPLVPTSVNINDRSEAVAAIEAVDSMSYRIDLDEFSASVEIGLSPFTYAAPDAITYEYSTDGGGTWQHVPADLSVTVDNSFNVTHFGLLLRPEGKPSVVTRVDVTMPMSTVFKEIIALVVVVALLMLYIIYVWVARLRREYVQRREAEAAEAARAEAYDMDGQDKSKYKSNPLSYAECSRVMGIIDKAMTHDKLFTDPDLKIATLARCAGISSHRLSQVFSQHLNKSFYDYVNTYRVNEFKRIAEHGGASRFTVTAMAESAGFSSRASFFRHFKEMEGISPGEYLKGLKG